MIRLFIPNSLVAHTSVAVSPEQARYLALVMRRSVGDEVQVFNGRDGEWLARVQSITKRAVSLEFIEQTKTQPSASQLELAIAMVKRSPLETIVEKATELGVGRIQLLSTKRTNSDHSNLNRLALIATEAAEQCGRMDVPEVKPPMGLSDWLNGLAEQQKLLFCDETGGAAAASVLQDLSDHSRSAAWSILIGPEGGFDPWERSEILSCPGSFGVSLGPRILRADTAAIAALSLWQAVVGDWRGT
jgi:16S rRNA (uracil1498-N3)-methyltransferase